MMQMSSVDNTTVVPINIVKNLDKDSIKMLSLETSTISPEPAIERKQ